MGLGPVYLMRDLLVSHDNVPILNDLSNKSIAMGWIDSADASNPSDPIPFNPAAFNKPPLTVYPAPHEELGLVGKIRSAAERKERVERLQVLGYNNIEKQMLGLAKRDRTASRGLGVRNEGGTRTTKDLLRDPRDPEVRKADGKKDYRVQVLIVKRNGIDLRSTSNGSRSMPSLSGKIREDTDDEDEVVDLQTYEDTEMREGDSNED
jgi:hypothetical protein